MPLRIPQIQDEPEDDDDEDEFDYVPLSLVSDAPRTEPNLNEADEEEEEEKEEEDTKNPGIPDDENDESKDNDDDDADADGFASKEEPPHRNETDITFFKDDVLGPIPDLSMLNLTLAIRDSYNVGEVICTLEYGIIFVNDGSSGFKYTLNFISVLLVTFKTYFFGATSANMEDSFIG
ncbi:hypothetical protein L6452_34782 [Arctium lappa]|uniref:Uncharacterized protein n=1 Tax=Arctium lappa TaxID=4217 RepID=A0ACB8YJN3_ARCLA|nr:hypothetical protein L6452_34782 [Arctium lappa]